jgi:phosphoribosylglycinamide formyltransferase-1
MTSRKRAAVLVSGRGANMTALIAAAKRAHYPAEIALVLSNRPDAAALGRANDAGVATAVVDHTRYGKDREAFEHAVQAVLENHRIELVCLAGFMRLLGEDFVARWHDRLINIHPSLLPEFRGLDTHKRALAAGVPFAGCTVHYVRAAVDDGPIIVQRKVPVLPGDDEARLAARVLAAEHQAYPLALRLIAEKRVRIRNDRVELRDNGGGWRDALSA